MTEKLLAVVAAEFARTAAIDLEIPDFTSYTADKRLELISEIARQLIFDNITTDEVHFGETMVRVIDGARKTGPKEERIVANTLDEKYKVVGRFEWDISQNPETPYHIHPNRFDEYVRKTEDYLGLLQR